MNPIHDGKASVSGFFRRLVFLSDRTTTLLTGGLFPAKQKRRHNKLFLKIARTISKSIFVMSERITLKTEFFK